jgi:hypothetical protein
MPALVVPNAALVRLIWTAGGPPYAVNVLGAHNISGTAVTQAACNAIGAAIKTALATSGLNAQLSTLVSLNSVGLRNINVANQVELLDNAAGASGTAAGDMLPPQIAFCLTLRTALAGRSFRGRMYIPGFAESASAGMGVAVAGVGTAAVAFGNAIMAAMSAQGLPLAIVSRPAPDRVPPSAGFVTEVTSVVSRDLVWDTQRRRAVPGI